MRRRCVWCVPNHVLDEGGPIRKGEEVSDGMCTEAAAKVALQLRAMNEEERARLTKGDGDAEEYLARLAAEQADDGTLEADDAEIKAVAWSILGILVCLLFAALWQWITD